MSPQKRYLTVEEYPPVKEGEVYRVRVKNIAIDKKNKTLNVIVENLDPTQLGRRHQLSLPLPIRPGNTTSLFLTACGTDASHVGNKVCLDDVVGVVVGISFERTAGPEDCAPVGFEHIPKPDIGGVEHGTSGTAKFGEESDAANGSDLC